MIFNRAPAERQVQAYRIVFESVEQRPAVDAESDPHAVRNEVTLEHPVVPRVTIRQPRTEGIAIRDSGLKARRRDRGTGRSIGLNLRCEDQRRCGVSDRIHGRAHSGLRLKPARRARVAWYQLRVACRQLRVPMDDIIERECGSDPITLDRGCGGTGRPTRMWCPAACTPRTNPTVCLFHVFSDSRH